MASSTPHSLPQSQSTSTFTNNSTTKRKPTQLPLPFSASNFSTSRSQPFPSSLPSPTHQNQSITRPYGRSSSNAVRPNPALPIGSGSERDNVIHIGPIQLSSPPANITSFQQAGQIQMQSLSQTSSPTNDSTSPTSPTSPTHVGGILPSANFFRPMRAYQSQVVRPSSAGSGFTSESHGGQGLSIMVPDPGPFPLAPLSQQRTRSSENLSGTTHGNPSVTLDHVSSGTPQPEIRNLNDEELRRQFSAPKRMKHSREPLLPIGSGGRPLTTINTNMSTYSATPAFVRVMSGGSLGGARDKTSPVSPQTQPPLAYSPAQRLRSSFDRVFKRSGSIDSGRKSIASGVTPSEGRPTFEVKRDHQMHQYKDSTGSSHGPPLTHDLTVSVSHLPMSPAPDHPFFISTPPREQPPLSAIPVKATGGRLIHNFSLHPSRNKFFFGGRFLTGGDSPWAFIASLSITLGITGVWFGTTCVWWWKHVSPAVAGVGAYACLIVISTMLTTAMRDPGILPRNLDPDPPFPSTSPSDGSRAPLPRDLKVRQDTVRVKYCPTCKTYRPPRSSHCKMCDNCVDGCDHHCQWVNNCVGRRNYTSFFAFLLSAVITLILVIVTSAIHIYLLTVRQQYDFREALVHGLGSTIAFCLSVLVIWPVAALLSYHMRLLLLNITTIEQIRNSAHKSLVPGAFTPPNPFSHGTWRRNLLQILCRPAGDSWLNGRGVATEDMREVNPVFGGKDGAPDPETGLGLGPRDWERDRQRKME